MRVAVMCCVLNEERNIERYCQVYSRFVDDIVICDGGSTDRTVELAKRSRKVQVVHFEEQMEFGGIPWNPLGKMHNFAYEAARKLRPDWIITDECDSLPTQALQKTARSKMLIEMEKSRFNVIGVRRIYVLGKDKFYPQLSLKGYFGWAHRPDRIDGCYRTSTHKGIPRPDFPHPDTGSWRMLDPPLALLHYGWPDEETVIFKTRRYRASGVLPEHGTAIPSGAGPIVPLPEWATWN